MKLAPLDEREFELVNIIGLEIATNQRDLSRHLDLSLGTVNMLIRRLIAKGYIRISQLNQRKVKYILTKKGFAEKMRKSVKYTRHTIESISLIKERLKAVFQELYQKGHKNFYVLGESDFAVLVEIVSREMNLNDLSIQFIRELPDPKPDGMILVCRENVSDAEMKGFVYLDLVKELAKDPNIGRGRG